MGNSKRFLGREFNPNPTPFDLEQRAGELATLKDLRLAVEHTQQDLAASLGVGQDTISRIERRSDLLLSTLRRYIQAMGGELDLVARFPNRPPVLLDHIAQVPTAKGRAASTKQTGSRGKAIA